MVPGPSPGMTINAEGRVQSARALGRVALFAITEAWQCLGDSALKFIVQTATNDVENYIAEMRRK